MNNPNTNAESNANGTGSNGPDADPVAGDLGRSADAPRRSPLAGWLGNAAADLLGPGLILATQDQGYTAAVNGDHVDACPWRTGTTDRDRALRQMWIRGYSAGRTDLRIARTPNPSPE